MTYKAIVEKYPNKYVIAKVKIRDKNNFVKEWEVLSSDSVSFNEAVETYNHYWEQGVRGICIMNCNDTDDAKPNEASVVARMFRLQYGTDME